jgi:predicted Zn finger-like uncharacterized protein
MKIVCDTCGTKYSVSDDKVRGKVFKIRCKKCEEVIVVRGTDGEGGEVDPRTATCWHVVLEGQQQGPYTAAQIGELVAAGQIDPQTHCWREGFADWKRIADVDVLAAVSGAAAPSAAATSAAAGDDVSLDDASDEEGGFGGFTAPATASSPPDTAGAALSDMFGGTGAAPRRDEPAGDRAARDAGRDGGADLFAGAAASAGADLFTGAAAGGGADLFAGAAAGDGADLFGSASAGGLFPDDPAGGAAPAPVSAPTSMTGARNESSVLFSLSNLQSLSKASAAGPEEAAPKAPGAASSSAGTSGLIDIRTMASTAAPVAARKEADVDALLSIGGGFGMELGAPVLAPVASTERSNTLMYAIIGVGAAVVVAIVVLVLVLVMDDDVDGTPTAAVDQPQVLAPGVAPGVLPAGAVPTAPPQTSDVGGPAPVPITDETPPTPGDESGGPGSNGKRLPGATKRPDESAPTGEQPAKAPDAPPPQAPQNPEQVKRATSALEALLDGAVGTPAGRPAGTPAAPTKTPGPTPAPSASGLPDQLSRSQVQGGMNGVADRVRRCGNGESGSVMVTVVIDGGSGRVTSANVDGPFAGTPVGSCAARAVRGATFPRFGQPSLSVRYPFQIQ